MNENAELRPQPDQILQGIMIHGNFSFREPVLETWVPPKHLPRNQAICRSQHARETLQRAEMMREAFPGQAPCTFERMKRARQGCLRRRILHSTSIQYSTLIRSVQPNTFLGPARSNLSRLLEFSISLISLTCILDKVCGPGCTPFCLERLASRNNHSLEILEPLR